MTHTNQFLASCLTGAPIKNGAAFEKYMITEEETPST